MSALAGTVNKKTEGIGVFRYALYGINIIFGLTFLVSIGGVYRNSGDWMFLLFALGAVVIFAVGAIYAYLSRALPNAKGGIYSYTKSAFGYRYAFFYNWCQYIVSPTILIGETLSVVLSFSGLSWYHDWYWLVLILSIVLFIGLSVLLVFGLRSTKVAIIGLTIISFLSIAFFIFSSFSKFGTDFFPNLVASPTKSSVSFQGIISSFFTFFFALGGIEYLATSSEELKDKKGGVIKAIVFVMLFSLCGYLLLTLIIKGVLGPNALRDSSYILGNNSGVAPNPINAFWFVIFGSTGGVVIVYIFAVIKIMSESNARLNLGWLSARVIEPLAEDGFLPASWAHRNRHNQLQKAIFYHSLFTFILLGAIIAPLFLYPNESNVVSAPFQIYSIIAFVQYIGVAASFVALTYRNKIPKNTPLLACAWSLLAVLPGLLVLWVYATISQGLQGDPTQWIALGSSIGAILLVFPAYWAGSAAGLHKKGWKSKKVVEFDHISAQPKAFELPFDSK